MTVAARNAVDIIRAVMDSMLVAHPLEPAELKDALQELAVDIAGHLDVLRAQRPDLWPESH
jgi:hypothetical protein